MVEQSRIGIPRVLDRIKQTVNQAPDLAVNIMGDLLEFASRKGLLDPDVDIELGDRSLARIKISQPDGSRILLDIDEGRNDFLGVLVRIRKPIPEYDTDQVDIFYSLHETGKEFIHLQETPFLDERWVTKDTSLQRLMPYRDIILQAVSHHKKARQTLENGFTAAQEQSALNRAS